MHITVQRSGGLANIGAHGEVDTTKLPDDKSAEVQKLVKAMPATPPAPLRTQGAADVYQFDITVDGKKYTADELSIPEGWRTLADLVLTLSS